MQLSEEKIELLKKTLPKLYGFVVNVTSLLEGDLSYIKTLSKDEIEKPEIDLKLRNIQDRANNILDRLKKTIRECKTSLELSSTNSLVDVLLSKEVNESLTFNEKFIASAIATAISKIKED